MPIRKIGRGTLTIGLSAQQEKAAVTVSGIFMLKGQRQTNTGLYTCFPKSSNSRKKTSSWRGCCTPDRKDLKGFAHVTHRHTDDFSDVYGGT